MLCIERLQRYMGLYTTCTLPELCRYLMYQYDNYTCSFQVTTQPSLHSSTFLENVFTLVTYIRIILLCYQIKTNQVWIIIILIHKLLPIPISHIMTQVYFISGISLEFSRTHGFITTWCIQTQSLYSCWAKYTFIQVILCVYMYMCIT